MFQIELEAVIMRSIDFLPTSLPLAEVTFLFRAGFMRLSRRSEFLFTIS